MMVDANLLVALALKSLVVAAAALALLGITRNRSAAERSLIGHLGLLALVLLPAATWLVPSWNPLPATTAPTAIPIHLPALTNAGTAAPAPAAAAPISVVAAPASFTLASISEIAVWVYLIPALLLFLAMVIAVVRLGAMHRRANVLVNPSWQAALAMAQRRMGFKHGTALLVSGELRSPVSWGVMRPIILLNEQAVDATGEAEAIIAHELAHVARLDWAKLLIARLACAMLWFNPLAWRLARECHQLREEAADDAVLLSEVDGAEYASLLVNAARHDNKALLIAAHGVAPGKDSLKRRITRVLDADLARGPANNGWAALCLVALVAVAAPLAAFDPTYHVPSAGSDASSIVLAARNGHQVLTINHFPNGHVTLSAGAFAAGDDKSAELARNRDQARDDEVDAIIASKAVGLTPDYVNSMHAAGFNGSVDDLTGARAVGVTPEFARAMREFDPSVDLDTITGAKATGLNPGYFSQMRQVFPGLSLDDAVGMSALGVTADFARQMRALFPRISAEQVQGMAAVGVTPDSIRERRREGIDTSTPDEAIQNRVLSHGWSGPRVPAVPAAAAAAVANSVAVSTSMANSIVRSVTASLPQWREPHAPPAPHAPPMPPAPPGTPDDN